MNTQMIALLVMIASTAGMIVGNRIRDNNERLGKVMVWGLACTTLISLLILVYQVMGGNCA